MAKSPGPVNTVSNNTSARTEGDFERAAAAKLELSMKRALDAALNNQIQILFQGIGVVGLAARAARDGGSPIDGSISQNDAVAIWTALDGAYALLSGVAGKLEDCDTLLAAAVANYG